MKYILYFTADWCNPCQRTKPVAEELDRDGIIKFQFIDVDDNIDLTKLYDIKSVPTFILIDDNKEIKRMSGAKTKEQFLDFLGNNNG